MRLRKKPVEPVNDPQMVKVWFNDTEINVSDVLQICKDNLVSQHGYTLHEVEHLTNDAIDITIDGSYCEYERDDLTFAITLPTPEVIFKQYHDKYLTQLKEYNIWESENQGEIKVELNRRVLLEAKRKVTVIAQKEQARVAKINKLKAQIKKLEVEI